MRRDTHILKEAEKRGITLDSFRAKSWQAGGCAPDALN